MRKPVLIACIVAAAACMGAAVLSVRPHESDAARPRQTLPPGANLEQRLAAADPGAGATLFSACAACHTVRRGGADVDGPNLFGVVGSRVAERRPRYNYSAALRNAGGIWTPARLDAWLTNPGAFAPGTTMGFPGLPDAQDRADVIAYLATQGSQEQR